MLCDRLPDGFEKFSPDQKREVLTELLTLDTIEEATLLDYFIFKDYLTVENGLDSFAASISDLFTIWYAKLLNMDVMDRLNYLDWLDEKLVFAFRSFDVTGFLRVQIEHGAAPLITTSAPVIEAVRKVHQLVKTETETAREIAELIFEAANKEDQNTSGNLKASSSGAPIQWKRKLPLLAYLFYRLEREGIIKDGDIGANLASIFIDCEYNAIDNKQINSYLSKLRTTNKTTQGKEQIDELVEIPKSLGQ